MGTLVNLTSRAIRSAAVSGGTRKIANGFNTTGGGKGFFEFIKESLLKKVIPALAGLISWTFTAIFSGIVAAVSFIWNFNWNITDEEINQSIETNFLAIEGLIGGGLGRTFGYIACGALPAAGIMAFNPTLGKYIASEVAENLIPQLAEYYASIAQESGKLLLNSGFLWLYGSIRRAFRGSDEDLKTRLKAAGVNEKKIQEELEARRKPFVIAQKIQEGIDSISNKHVKAIVNQAYGEFGQACVEAGYVVAGSLDKYYEQQQGFGGDTIIEVEFTEDGKTKVKQL